MSSVVFRLLPAMVAACLLFLTANGADLGDPATQSRINHVCAKSYDYNLCRDIFHQHLFSNVTDFKGLTQIAIAQTLLFSSDTLTFLKKSQRDERDKTQRDLYEVCVEGYQLLLNQFEDAFLDLAKGDYRPMLNEMSFGERFVDKCDAALGGRVADVQKKNHETKVLVKMSNVSGELIGTNVV